MLLIMTITLVARRDISTALSLSSRSVGDIFAEFQRIWEVKNGTAAMASAIHDFIETRDGRYLKDYERARSRVHEALDDDARLDLSPAEQKILASITADIRALEQKSERIFSLAARHGGSRETAFALMREFDGIAAGMERDFDQYREENTIRMGRIVVELREIRSRINLLFFLIPLLSAAFLLLFGVYLHRKITAPLNELWKGAEEVSRGNLDYRVKLRGSGDVARLAERFNEMAQQIGRSYADLENRLLERTNDLAAIDSVALMLSRAGNLKDMLMRSLGQITESLSGLEPQGGVFLCDPSGETLHLVAHKGLSPEFVKYEETIRAGECLCGIAAQTGEIMYSKEGCANPLHTRRSEDGEHSHIIIPIKARGIVLGVVFLYPRREFTLKPSDIQLLDTIGSQLGMAVENLRFYAEVKESSEKFWDHFENSRDILFTIDASGTLTAVNKAAEKFSGYTKSELVGKNVLDFLTPDASRTARQLLGGQGIDSGQMIEFAVVKRDGSHAFLEMSARRLFVGRTPAGFQISARDITEQKLMREKLLHAERLGAIGQVVIAVRHEINNPLTTVIGNIELLIERYGDKDKDLATRLEIILNNALRIAEIVQRLQEIKRDKVVPYVKGVTMTDLKQE